MLGTEETIQVTSGSISDRGLSEKRPQNEDSYLEIGRCGIYAVADGVGGAQAGEVASQMAVEILGEAFTNRDPSQDPESVMQAAITQANAAIFQMAQELPQLASMATTIVALHLADNIATIGHVGDSRLYRVDSNGNLTPETDDHSMVAEEVRAGRMTAEQAENHPGRNIINRALGAEPIVDIDLKTIMVERGTSFLLCSDGITRHVSDAEIRKILTSESAPETKCDYLRELCYDRGAEDNLTAVIVQTASPGVQTAESVRDDAASESDEDTVASARDYTPAAPEPDLFEDTEEILELDPEPAPASEEVSNGVRPLDPRREEPEEPSVHELPPIVPAIAAEPAMAAQAADDRSFSIFGSDTSDPGSDAGRRPSGMRSLPLALAMLTLGSIIGMLVYYFALAPAASPAGGDSSLSVMKTEDIAFSSFERLRRTVDADPAAFIRELPQPDDAADYYLVGRANLLLGDFPKARLALIEAQKRLPQAESANAKVLKADIASGLAITNDPNMQNHFRQLLEAGSAPAAGSVNPSR